MKSEIQENKINANSSSFVTHCSRCKNYFSTIATSIDKAIDCLIDREWSCTKIEGWLCKGCSNDRLEEVFEFKKLLLRGQIKEKVIDQHTKLFTICCHECGVIKKENVCGNVDMATARGFFYCSGWRLSPSRGWLCSKCDKEYQEIINKGRKESSKIKNTPQQSCPPEVIKTVRCDQELWIKDTILRAMKMAISINKEKRVLSDELLIYSGLDGIANGTAIEIINILNMSPEYTNLKPVDIDRMCTEKSEEQKTNSL